MGLIYVIIVFICYFYDKIIYKSLDYFIVFLYNTCIKSLKGRKMSQYETVYDSKIESLNMAIHSLTDIQANVPMDVKYVRNIIDLKEGLTERRDNLIALARETMSMR